MPLQTLPNAFSITALLSDQVALLARHQRLSPGAASVLLRQLMDAPKGRERLMRILDTELQRESNPVEAAKIAEVRSQTQAWITDLDSATPADTVPDNVTDFAEKKAARRADSEAPSVTHTPAGRRHRALPRPLGDLRVSRHRSRR